MSCLFHDSAHTNQFMKHLRCWLFYSCHLLLLFNLVTVSTGSWFLYVEVCFVREKQYFCCDSWIRWWIEYTSWAANEMPRTKVLPLLKLRFLWRNLRNLDRKPRESHCSIGPDSSVPKCGGPCPTTKLLCSRCGFPICILKILHKRPEMPPPMGL